ncbi:hypothetical protein HW555_013717 [Spodoptera exigua]|uniref:Uncharacterized protein n=1 Tax=Spodoptera exigua TaxID=7107 RepID=A0A835KWQ2_SPOEX|nr:hypothetical protein HW555_013717 [Spodoptera exigua]
MVVYWTLDVLHPSALAIMPIGISCVLSGVGMSFISEIYIRNDLLDCIGVMMIIIAIENSMVHRRIAIKVLLVFGCSHYRLSFLLFFTSMFLSMWISNILACGLMMPIVKAILAELERMGIVEVYQTIGKATQKSNRHEQNIFPLGPKIEFPHFMLLNLPGVLVMETLLYMWMNFAFLGMFRTRSDVEVGLTEEESQYIDTLLATQYHQLGKPSFHEIAVSTIATLTALLQATISTAHIDQTTKGSPNFHKHLRVSSPCALCVVLLFVTPVNLEFLRYFKKRTAGSSNLFESLRDSEMLLEFEKFLLIFKGWPASALVFTVVLFCKILTEFASNFSVVYALLPSIAKVSVLCDVNPHYLMMASTLASCLPFHLVTGAPVNAMVSAYMYAGLGPSVISVIVVWFTVAVWSNAIWTDITISPQWAHTNIFGILNKQDKN